MSKSSYKIEVLPSSHADVGEAPHWDIDTQNLYTVDVVTGKLYRYSFKENKTYSTKIEGADFSSFVIPVKGEKDKFAVGVGRRVVIVHWDGIEERCKIECSLYEVQKEEKFKENRFNDAKIDPKGRLFAGTMKHGGDEFAFRLGELYKFEKGKTTVLRPCVSISNGLEWNVKEKKFYFADTTDMEVLAFDYDIDKGAICNPKQIFNCKGKCPEDDLWPDGMTIDTEGNLYVAMVNGYKVFKIEPCSGKVLLEIKLPCKKVTSCCFGGPELDILYVTTSARFGDDYPAGSTFKVTCLGAKGLPMNKFVA